MADLKPKRTCETCEHSGYIYNSDLLACMVDYPDEQYALLVVPDDGCPRHEFHEYFKAKQAS